VLPEPAQRQLREDQVRRRRADVDSDRRQLDQVAGVDVLLGDLGQLEPLVVVLAVIVDRGGPLASRLGPDHLLVDE
jgi:hypothetical protein